MLVSEIFQSIQGECLTQGASTVFVRFAGCNLNCSWCDTLYSQDRASGTDLSVSAIEARVRDLSASPRFVCLTGGEPLVQPEDELSELIGCLIEHFPSLQRIVVETNGSRPIEWLSRSLARSQLSLSVDCKLPSSEMDRSMVMRNFHELDGQKGDTLKFVCVDPVDVRASLSVLRGLVAVHSCRPIVFYHAAGGSALNWLAEFVLSDPEGFGSRFDIRFGVQLHKLIWANERGR